MIPFSDALSEVLIAARSMRLKDEDAPLIAARGRVLAADVQSLSDIPRFANSSMDGFAVLASATPGNFTVTQQLVAGDVPGADPVTAERTIEIMTGAPMPPGADAVVKIEDASVHRGEVTTINVANKLEPGQNVRVAGEDYRAGAKVAEKGAWLSAERLLAIAQTGHGQVRVKVRPKVLIIPTGRELEVPGATLPSAASLWASSSVYLTTALEAVGCDVRLQPIVRDDVDEFLRVLDRELEWADLVLTTGAVSQGVHDFVPGALQKRGAKERFHKVAIRPAKPALLTELGGKLVFGLPGNPISTAVAFRFLVWPALASMYGMPPEKPTRAGLLAPTKKPFGLRCFYKAHMRLGGVEIAEGQGSHLVRPLAECNAWASLDEDAEKLAAGTEIDVYPLLPRGFA